MSDAVVEIDLEWKSRGTSHVQKMKGTVQEIAREVKKLDTSKFNSQLKITQKDLDAMSNTIRKNGNLFTKMGSKAVISARETKKHYQKLHDIMKKSETHMYKIEGGKKKRISKQEYENYRRLNKEIQKHNQIVRESGYYENTRIKRTQNATKSNLAMVASMNKILRSAQSKAYVTYNQQIKRMSAEMDKAKMSAADKAKVLKKLEDQMQRIARMDISAMSRQIVAGGGDADSARELGVSFTDQLREQQAEVKKHISKMNEFRSHLHGLKQMILGGVGFTMIDVGGLLGETFSNKRLSGSVSGATSGLAASIGSMFGDLPGAIMGDLGKAAGNIAEAFFNTMTFSFRATMVALGGFLKGFGTGLLGVAFSPLKGAVALTGGILGGVLGGLQSILSVWKETLAEMMDLAKKLMESVVSIFSAGFKVVGGIFSTVWNVISTTWSNIWDGMKEAVKNTMDFTLDAVAKMTQASLAAFAKQETLATKAAKETLGTSGGGNVSGMGNLARRTSAIFGTDVADTQEALFDVVSSGYQKMAEANSILSASARLAKQDSSTVANATNALITIYQNYGDQVKSVARVSDILSAATTVGRTSLMEMGPSLKSVIPVARMFNIQLEDVMVSISSLTRIFGRGSTPSATRYLSRFLESIAQPSASARKELNKLGVSLEMLQRRGGIMEALQRISGAGPEVIRKFMPTIQARRASALSTQRGQQVFRTTEQQFRASLGGGSQKLALEQETLANRMQKVGAAVASVKNKFGSFLSDIIKFTFFNKSMNKLWQRFNVVINSSKMDQTIGKVANIAKSILLPVAKSILHTFKSIVSTFEGFALGDFLKNREFVAFARELKLLSNNVWEFIKSFDASAIKSFGTSALNTFKGIVKWTRLMSDWLLKGWDNFKQKFTPIVEDIWGKFKTTASDAFDWVINTAASFLVGISDLLTKGVNVDVGSMFGDFGEPLQKLFSLSLNVIEKMFIKTFLGIRGFLVSIFSSLPDMLKDAFHKGLGAMKQTVMSMMYTLEKFNDMSDPARTAANKATAKDALKKMGAGRDVFDQKLRTVSGEYRSGEDILKSVRKVLMQSVQEEKSAGLHGSKKMNDAFATINKINKALMLEKRGGKGSNLADIMRSDFEHQFAFARDKMLTAQHSFNKLFKGGSTGKISEQLKSFDNAIVDKLNGRLENLNTSIGNLNNYFKNRQTTSGPAKGITSKPSPLAPTPYGSSHFLEGQRFSEWANPRASAANSRFSQAFRTSPLNDDGRSFFMDRVKKNFSSYKGRIQGAITSGKMTQEEGKQKVQRTFNDMRDALKHMDRNLSEAQKKTMTQDQLKEAFQRALENVRNKPQKVIVAKDEKPKVKSGSVDGGGR